MKTIIAFLGILLLTSIATADIYIEDKIYGKNLPVIAFEDELGLIDAMVYNDMIKTERNTFRGFFGMEFGDDFSYQCKDVEFSGLIRFDDRSKVEYELIDYEIEEAGLDPWGLTEAWGTGTLRYEAVIHITKEIPVETMFIFYQDEEDKDSFMNYMSFQGEDFNFELESDEKQLFRHRRKCSGDCE